MHNYQHYYKENENDKNKLKAIKNDIKILMKQV